MYKLKFLAFAALTLLFACKKGGYETTEKGVKYTFLKKNDSAKKISNGNIVTFYYAFYNMKDSMISDLRMRGYPESFRFEDQYAKTDTWMEMFSKMGEKDSLAFITLIDSLSPQIPQGMKTGEEVKVILYPEKVMTMAEYRADRKAMMDEMRKKEMERLAPQVAKDDELLQAYFKKNKLEPKKTESGLYYIITQEGSGDTPKDYDIVSVHYTGTLLDGKKFDSSLDRGEAFKFPLSEGQVIPGWDEGIALLNKGAKATLFIPSHLGYGDRPMGEAIPALSILKFEVELVDFTKGIE